MLRDREATQHILLTLVLCAVAAAQARACQDRLFALSTYEVGYFPWDIAAGDFNGDGQPDLATTSTLSEGLHILLGRGGGSFTVSAAPLSGLETYGVVVGDFDLDGVQDLATGNGLADTVSVLLGAGDGTFTHLGDFDAGLGTSPGDLTAGDFDADGLPDVATANGVDDTVTLLRGLGDGQLVLLDLVAVAGGPGTIVVADFDDDSRPDLATANEGADTISIVKVHGTAGGYSVSATHPAGPNLQSLALGDVDGNGMQDLVAATLGGPGLPILLGQADGSFVAGPPDGASGSAQFVAVGDLDGDGRQDLAATLDQSAKGSVRILLGQGDATFTTQDTYIVGTDPHSAVLADLDSDGRLDIATADSLFPGAVSILLATGQGKFQGNSSFPTGHGPRGLARADFDGDGDDDLATPDGLSDTLTVLLGDGQGAVTAFFTIEPVENPSALAAADFDLDGVQDLAVPNSTLPPTVSTFIGLGNGNFSPRGSFGVGPNPQEIYAGDFNDDGVPDLITAHHNINATASILLGVGDGTFVVHGDGGIDLRLVHAAIGDFDGDGHQDLAASVLDLEQVMILLGDGTGDFAVGAGVDVGDLVRGVCTSDFNADGILDIAAVSIGYGGVDAKGHVLLGHGDGSFVLHGSHAVWPGAKVLVAADFNGDGDEDVATANDFAGYGPATGTVTVLLGDGTGDLVLHGSFGANSTASGIVVGDFDGNGRQDIATSNVASSLVTILLGQLTSAWQDIGSGLAGLAGTPSLVGEGSLEAGSGGAVQLSSAAPSSPALLFLSLASDPASFKCGTLVPAPDGALLPATTGPDGDVSLDWDHWPAGLSGIQLYWQYAIQDDGATCGVALSNALKADVP